MKTIYVCRQCETEFTVKPPSSNVTDPWTYLSWRLAEGPKALLILHRCAVGRVGIAELVGAEEGT